METNPNTKNGEETPETTIQSQFTGFDSSYSHEDHLKSLGAGIENDFELSKNCFPKNNSSTDPIVDDSHFKGEDPKRFNDVHVPTLPKSIDNTLPKGTDYRKENNSSLL